MSEHLRVEPKNNMTMRAVLLRAAGILFGSVALAASAAPSDVEVEVEFIPSTAAHGYAVRMYRSIWEQYGARIVSAFEARTCLPFVESKVWAVVADAVSHSGGPHHPMRLRGSYAPDVKRSTLVHELGHRHLWQLAERLDGLDGHRTLYLVLDRVWADVWGEEFARERIRGESEWRAEYDYAGAWEWARSLAGEDRLELWNRLLRMNGFQGNCTGLLGAP
ncbi:MAG TPA: hypothetical protein VF329_06360 [Gammaproteobacteria bacterium]